MDKNDLERRLEAAEKQNLGLLDEIKNLKAQLAEMQNEPEIPDKPDFENDEKFYYLSSCTDDIEDSCHDGDIDVIDFNMFHTADYAHEFRRKCLLIAMMLHCKWYLDRDYVPDFTNISEEKYFVCYDHVDGCFKYGLEHLFDSGSIIFSSEEAAKKCVYWLNERWKEDDNGKTNSETP